jgi:hypothetical protein
LNSERENEQTSEENYYFHTKFTGGHIEDKEEIDG